MNRWDDRGDLEPPRSASVPLACCSRLEASTRRCDAGAPRMAQPYRLSPGRVACQMLCVLCGLLPPAWSAIPANAQTPPPHDYAAVDAIFSRHCLDCHASPDAEGQFVLESFDTLMKGGEIGPAVVPGKSGESLLIKMIEGRFEKEGKKKIMPPGKRKKLAPEEIALLKAWIDAGAPHPRPPACRRNWSCRGLNRRSPREIP